MLGGMVAYAVCFLCCYPRIFAIVDEDAYLTQALLFRTGHLSYTNSPIPPPHMTVNMAGRLVSKYPPGNALFLVPFTALGWRGVFVSGLLLALVGTGLCALTLRQLAPAADPDWALLFLYYPAVTIYSRTVMSDLLAAVAALAGFYLLIRDKGWLLLSGACLGFACLVRYSTVVLVPALLLSALILRHRTGTSRQLFLLIPGLALFLGMALAYNRYAFGGPLQFPFFLTGNFSPSFIPRNLLYYSTTLLAWYPLMLLAPLALPARLRFLLGLPPLAILALYAPFSYLPQDSTLPGRLVLGTRYLLPAIPFLVLGFVIGMVRWGIGRWQKGVVKSGLLVLAFLGSTALQVRHSEYLNRQDFYRRLVYDLVPRSALLFCNRDVAELVSYAWGWRDCRPLANLDSLNLTTVHRPVFWAWLSKDSNRILPTPHRALRSWSLVFETDRPYRFELYRLMPAQ